MEDLNILDIDYAILSQIRSVLENPSTIQAFLEVLPPDCTRDEIRSSLELSSGQYNNTPAKELLRFLGGKGARVSDFIRWFEEIGLERALRLLKREEALRIVEQPQKEVKVKEGCELLLVCTAVSYPPPEYQWYKDDVELLVQIDPVLSIKSARLEDSGIYTCRVIKLDTRKNVYEWLYSDFSKVEVIPSDLHAIPPYEGSITSPSLFVIGPESMSPLKTFEQGKEVSLLHEGNSISHLKFTMPGRSEKISSLETFDPDQKVSLLLEKNSVSQPKLVTKPQTSESSNREVIVITKHPFVDGKIAQGMSLCLTCEAVSSSLPVNYQWIKNGRPLQGETASQLILNHLYPDPETGERKWDYQCEVHNERDRVFSQIAVIELDESNDRTPYIATQKYAFMVANDTYENLENLEKPSSDIKDLADQLSSIGFHIFACRNLTLTEMRNAFTSYCKMLKPGSYALFFFAGHGFDIYGQTYLQPVDSSDNPLQHESMCSEYILECLQERKPAMNILLIDACRKLPPNLKNSDSQYRIPPGRIFEARMKNNTIYGYSTSFLCASHESDDESNSVFVKHLKKHITCNKFIYDILVTVQNEFAKDPVAKNVQFPVVKSTLSERRKLTDSVQDTGTSLLLSDMMDWCDIKREIILKSCEIPQMKAAIIIEFHHHMEVFCNGIDVYVYLHAEPNARMFVLYDMEINITFISDVLNITPTDGVALKEADFITGRRNFLFKKEISDVQRINTTQLEGNILLKFISKNVTQKIDFNVDLVKISELQLSINHLASSNVEVPLLNKHQSHAKNSFK